MKKSYLIITSLILFFQIAQEVSAQKFRHRKEKHSSSYSRKSESIFPQTFDYEPNGWVVDPGITYTLTQLGSKKVNFGDSIIADFVDKGKVRVYLGFGRFRMLEYWHLFKYFDYGIAYKWIGGKENYEASYVPLGVTNSGTGKFNDHNVLAFLNFNNIIDVRDGFVQNSIGATIDYTFLQSRKSQFGVGERFPDRFVAQLHYKIGYGFMPNNKLLLIPSIEIPIVGFMPDIPNPMLPYFNSKYLPIIISVRCLLIRPKRDVCIPIEMPDLPEGFTPDGMGE